MNKEAGKKILFEARGIYKSFGQGEKALSVLRGVDIELHQGEAICILGSSGAGKSTLLHILGTLDRPDSGEVFFQGEKLQLKDEEEVARFRASRIGFVFQFHHLLSEFTALENVAMPARILGKSIKEATQSARELLVQVGLANRLEAYPNELSGGELQRVAIARALVNGPQILFADEPTGNLDSGNRDKVQDLFLHFQKERNLSLVVVTHDLTFAQKFHKLLRMQDGRFV